MVYVNAITKTRLFKYTENFTTKNDNFSDKKILIFFIFLHKKGGSNGYPQSMFLADIRKITTVLLYKRGV